MSNVVVEKPWEDTRKKMLIVLLTLAAVLSEGVGADTVNLAVNASHTLGEVSDVLFGIFFEEINHAGDGQLVFTSIFLLLLDLKSILAGSAQRSQFVKNCMG